MGVIEIGAIVLTGAGTLGSVLGLFYSYATKENGKLTRAVMTDSDEKTRTLIREMHDKTDATMRTMHEDNKALLQSIGKQSMTAHEENKALLAAIVELLKKNGSGR